MDVISLDTRDESDYVLKACYENSKLFQMFTYIGGISNSAKGKDGWIWWNSGKRVNYPLDWAKNEPNFLSNVEHCLSIANKDGVFKLNDMPCFGQHDYKFTCQKSEFKKIP